MSWTPRQLVRQLLLAMVGLMGFVLNPAATAAAPGAASPAIVLATQPLPGSSAAIRDQLAQRARERFPGREIQWAALPGPDPALLSGEGQANLPELGQVLADLKSRNIPAAAIQPLAVVPGGHWEQQLSAARSTAGLKIALGQPLLSSLADRQRLLSALANTFTANNQDQAVLLVSSGGPNPVALRENLALYTLLLARFKGSNLFFGTVNSLPEMKTIIAGVKKSSANSVTIIPLPAFADGPVPSQQIEALGAYKNELAAAKAGSVQIFQEGLGSIDGILAIYVDHLADALNSLAPKKPAKQKKGRK